MGKQNPTGRSKKTPDDYFVQLYKTFLQEPAWRSLPMGARVLYIAVKSYYNGTNNGELFMSVRDAAALIGCTPRSAHRWFQELTDKGFLRRTGGGSLGADGKGEAQCWRLTEIGHRNHNIVYQPSREYKEWTPTEKTESRIPEGYKLCPQGIQQGDKCIPEGNTCAPEGYRNEANTPPSCTPEGNTSNSQGTGGSGEQSETPSNLTENDLGTNLGDGEVWIKSAGGAR